MGNNQWNYHPVKIAPSGFCEFLTSDAYTKFYEDFQKHSNFSKPGDCPAASGTYKIENYVLQANWFADAANFRDGMYRVENYFLKDNQVQGMFNVYMKLVRHVYTQ
jgi:hypothetical protein